MNPENMSSHNAFLQFHFYVYLVQHEIYWKAIPHSPPPPISKSVLQI